MICACGALAEVGPICDACLRQAGRPLLPTPRPPRRRGRPGVIDADGRLRWGGSIFGTIEAAS